MEGFYKFDGENWYYEEPLEYTVFKIKQNTDKTLSQDYEETN